MCGCCGRALLRACLKLRFELARPGARSRECVELTRPDPAQPDPITAGRALSRVCLKLRLDLSTCDLLGWRALSRVCLKLRFDLTRPDLARLNQSVIEQCVDQFRNSHSLFESVLETVFKLLGEFEKCFKH